MRIAVGALLFEGNTFSPVVTRRDAFEANYCAAGVGVLALEGTGTEIGGALAEAKRRAIDVAPLLATHGGAGGRVARDVHDGFVADLLARIEAALPVDDQIKQTEPLNVIYDIQIFVCKIDERNFVG